ncbi:ABC transporter ATP-binding protein, partial [Verminephrobacter sp. Larva24]
MPHDAPTPTPPLLSIEQLSIPLPPGADRPYAVEDITLQLQRGEILCIVGESGSGKSMSANAIMGLLPPGIAAQGGRILFQGRDLLQLDEAALLPLRGKDMAMVFQEPLSALNPLMTVGEQIAEVLRVHRSGRNDNARAWERRVLELLEFVGLPDPAALRH